MKLPILILNPHNRCNCRCMMCDIWKRSDVQEFNTASLQHQMDSVERLGVEWVVLTGGEPLMSLDLFPLCATLRARGIRLTLLSSGLLLERHAAEIVEHVDDVIVSLDGPPEIHNRIRNIHRAFELLEAGVRRIHSLRPNFPIAARCTVQRVNCGHLRRTVTTARSLGLQSISFLAADTHSEAFDHRLPVVSNIIPEIAVLESEIEAIGAVGDFVLESPEKLRRIVNHFRGQLMSPVCNAPWHSAVVETDGTVRPCFFHAPIGQVSQTVSLSEVLNGDAAVAFRESLDVASNATCRRCVCSLNWKTS